MSEVATIAALPPAPVFLHDGRATTTSREVAEFFGKRHDNVLQSVARLECSEAFRRLNFQESSYLNAQGKQQPLVTMSRDGFAFLAMGFTGSRAARFKEAFITAFNALEERQRGGGELPLLQRQLELLAQRQAAADAELSTLLDLVDVTTRYVQALETNQKPPRRPACKQVTPALAASCRDLFAQGLSTTAVSRLLGIGRSTAHLIKHGRYVTANLAAGAPA